MADQDWLTFPGLKGTGPLVRPVVGAALSDTWGAARSGGRRHEGIDIFAPEGTPIHAVASGTVVQGFQNDLGGNVVRIQGDDGRYYYYAHLTPDSFDHLEVGQHVNAGQVLGGVGHTGGAMGTPDHLHLQVRENGEWINPYDFLTPLPDLDEVVDGAVPPATEDPPDPFAIDAGSPPSLAADTDLDGLTDEFEELFGTDPTQVDTDADGLSDAHEAAVSHTDPLSVDTDADGLSDGFEVAGGTDPGRAELPDAVRAAGFGGLATTDSDEDGLSDLYEEQHGLDPMAPDSDGDGLSDGFEVARGLDPATLDSDADGLTDGFEAASEELGSH